MCVWGWVDGWEVVRCLLRWMVCARVRGHVCTFVYVCVHVCTCMYACMHVCVCMCSDAYLLPLLTHAPFTPPPTPTVCAALEDRLRIETRGRASSEAMLDKLRSVSRAEVCTSPTPLVVCDATRLLVLTSLPLRLSEAVTVFVVAMRSPAATYLVANTPPSASLRVSPPVLRVGARSVACGRRTTPW